MKLTRWNIVEELRTESAIVGYLTAVFERHPSEEDVLHALDVSIKAIKAHGLSLESAPVVESAEAVAV